MLCCPFQSRQIEKHIMELPDVSRIELQVLDKEKSIRFSFPLKALVPFPPMATEHV